MTLFILAAIAVFLFSVFCVKHWIGLSWQRGYREGFRQGINHKVVQLNRSTSEH